MDNNAIADQLSLLARLMDIHGENSFKAKSYATAAYAIEKLPQPLQNLSEEKIYSIRGIGESVGSKIIELMTTGELQLLQDYLNNTPEGVLELMNIKGLGPKKLHTLWKEYGIDNVEQLKEACQNNQVATIKGFGAKTQQNILEAISFQEQNTGKYLYAQIEAFAEAFQTKLQNAFPDELLQPTGAFRRHMEVIEKLEWITTISKTDLKRYMSQEGMEAVSESENELICSAKEVLQLHFYFTSRNDFYSQLFTTTGSNEFITAWKNTFAIGETTYATEEAIFQKAGISYIPPFLRESENIIAEAKNNAIPQIVEMKDIKGIIHSHSNWSDGAYTIEEMAQEAMRLGYEYLVVSDHSKAAYYANGLSEQRIKEQHKYIDELNKKLHPFKLFKSIECDILNDGAMDYSNKILSTFDLVIASVHSNLDMPEDKAMMRLMGAITNPYVTILGHMTGRILLRRKGYPVDHKTIINACAENSVVMEINASPYRLDIDWRWVPYALEQDVLLSVNPDAHSFDDMAAMKYGVLAAQKGGLTASHNLSSFNLQQFEAFLAHRKKIKGLL